MSVRNRFRSMRREKRFYFCYYTLSVAWLQWHILSLQLDMKDPCVKSNGNLTVVTMANLKEDITREKETRRQKSGCHSNDSVQNTQSAKIK